MSRLEQLATGGRAIGLVPSESDHEHEASAPPVR
jgi:hypothetical protein